MGLKRTSLNDFFDLLGHMAQLLQYEIDDLAIKIIRRLNWRDFEIAWVGTNQRNSA